MLPTRLTPWFNLLLLISFICIGALIGQALIILLLGFPTSFSQSLHTYNAASKNYLLAIQTILAGNSFIVAPLLYWILVEKKSVQYFFKSKQPYIYTALLTIGLVSSFILANAICIYWNMQLRFPAFLKGFEQWAQAQETELQALTTVLTTFSSTKDLGISILVMAILPAIGEELVFRGLLQRLLYQITHHVHLSIIISALIFSTIHLQFYGFLPRFLLGLLFGYIYLWTENLSLSILAHFFNNACTLLIIFLQQKTWLDYALQLRQLPPISITLLASLATFLFAKKLYQFTQSHRH
jgi:membrane protease YdiL (CAAX protease family)